MASGGGMPRNFKLLEEYDAAIGKEGKSLVTGKHAGLIQYGVDEERDDPLLHHWRGIIIGPQDSHIGQFMYTITIEATDNYPAEAPIVSFIEPKIKMPAVDDRGRVTLSKLEPKFAWNASLNIADVLMAVRENMYKESVSKASGTLQGTSY